MVDRNRSLKVFISYSRTEARFADQVQKALTATGFTVTIDREAPGGVSWWDNLRRLIRECDTVVFILSNASIRSTHCTDEVKEAQALSKRVLTLTCEKLDVAAAPADGPLSLLSQIQSIFFYEEPKIPNSGFGDGLSRLVEALNLHFDWVLDHTRYLQRAIEWQNRNKRADLLLRGGEIAEARDWQGARPDKAPEITPLQLEYFTASEAAEQDSLAARQKELAEREEAQRERLAALKNARRLLVALCILMLTAFSGTLWHAYQTSVQKALIFESKSMDALQEGLYDSAVRFGIAGLPAPGSLPLEYRSPVLEDIVRLANRSDQTIAILGEHDKPVTDAIYSPDGKIVITRSSLKGDVRLWNGETGAAIGKVKTTLTSSTPVVSSTGDRLLWWTSGTPRRAPDVWRIEGAGITEVALPPAPAIANWFSFSPDGKLIIADLGKSLAVWTDETSEPKLLEGHTGSIVSESISTDSRLLVSWARDDPAIRVWDLAAGTSKSLPGHNDAKQAKFMMAGARVVTVDSTHVRLWDTASCELIAFNDGTGPVALSAASERFYDNDGTRLLTNDGVNGSRLWDLATGKLIRSLPGKSSAASFNSDGTRIAVKLLGEPIVRLWDGRTGDAIADLAVQSPNAGGQFDQTGKFLLTSVGTQGLVILWNAVSGKRIAQLAGIKGAVSSVQFSPTGDMLVTLGQNDRTIHVWETVTGTPLMTLAGHVSPVASVKFSADGQRLVSRGANETSARLWSLRSRDVSRSSALPPENLPFTTSNIVVALPARLAPSPPYAQVEVYQVTDAISRRILQSEADPITSAKFVAKGTRLVTAGSTAGSDQLVLWDAETGERLQSLKHASGRLQLTNVISSGDGRVLATTANGDRVVHLWNAISGQHIAALEGHATAGIGISFSTHGKALLTVGWGEEFCLLWDTGTGRRIARLETGRASMYDINAAGDRIATAAPGSAVIKLWDATSGQLVKELTGHTGTAISSLEFSKTDGGLLLSFAKGETSARLWNAKTGEQAFELSGSGSPLTKAAFSQDRIHVFTAAVSDAGSEMRYWDPATGKQVALIPHKVEANSWPSADGKAIVTRGEAEATALLWSLEKGGTREGTLAEQPRAVKSAKFSPNGARIVITAESDTSAYLYDATRHGAFLRRLGPHAGAVSDVLITGDGKLIVTRADTDSVVRVWDGDTGKPIADLGFADSSPVRAFALVEGDKGLMTVTAEVIRLWDMKQYESSVTQDVFSLVCEDPASLERRQFSALETSSLRAFGNLRQPCSRRGPLHWRWWVQAFQGLLSPR